MKLAICFLYAALSALVVFSNQNDWDYSLSSLEVELRSWILDGKPPLWSYQLCAGTTRIGDPQSMGLSPLFLPVLIFGTLWGGKLMVLFCVALGLRYFSKVLLLLAPPENGGKVALSLSAFFVFGNYFLWHFHVGHITFALMLFSFMPGYYILLGFQRRLRPKEKFWLIFSAFTYCTAGFYHSLAFFVLPLICLFFLMVLLLRPRARKEEIRRAFSVLSLLSAGLLLSAYKWIPVILYQLRFPRSLADVLPEVNPVWRLLARISLPTYGMNYLGQFPDWGPWMVHEHSAFSVLVWMLPLTLGAAFFFRERIEWRKSWCFELLFCFLIVALFCGSSAISPLGLMNRWFLNGSLRVAGRYQIVLLFLIAVFLMRFLAFHPAARAFYLRWLAPLGVLLALVGMLGFLPLLEGSAFTSLHSSSESRMTRLHRVKDRILYPVSQSYMLPEVMAGAIVPNCYHPLARRTKIEHEKWKSAVVPSENEFDLIAPGKGAVSEECRKSVYVTQNDLYFSAEACPADLCFHLNMLNEHKALPLVWNPGRKLYCVQ